MQRAVLMKARASSTDTAHSPQVNRQVMLKSGTVSPTQDPGNVQEQNCRSPAETQPNQRAGTISCLLLTSRFHTNFYRCFINLTNNKQENGSHSPITEGRPLRSDGAVRASASVVCLQMLLWRRTRPEQQEEEEEEVESQTDGG